jgi:membrane associated rhomboid family serine protease
MFPVSDVIPSRTRPYATLALIALNTLVFAGEVYLDDRELQLVFRQFGVVPAHFSWVGLLPGLFLHAGWVHFLGNMLYLWIFGENVEDRLGHARFVMFYLFCGAAAAVAQAATQPYSTAPMVGASGAIAGVIGAYFAFFPQSRVLTAVVALHLVDLIEVPAVLFLGLWFLLQLFSGVGALASDVAVGAMAFWSHVSGFVVGGLFGGLWRVVDRTRWAR